MSLKLFLFNLEATAGQSAVARQTELREGGRYALNAFVVQANQTAAQANMQVAFGELGWRSIEVEAGREVPTTLATIGDPELKELAKVAGAKGFSYVVYSEERKPN